MCPTGLWHSAARTDPGKVRARNEDAFLECPQHGLWVVADGMGGHQGGDIASQLIVASLADLPVEVDFDARLKNVRQCLHWLNRRLGRDRRAFRQHHGQHGGGGIDGGQPRRVCLGGGQSVLLMARPTLVPAVEGPFPAAAID